MRYLAKTADLLHLRGFSRKLTRKWETEDNKKRQAKVFPVLVENADSPGFGEFTRSEALRDPGVASLIILEGEKHGIISGMKATSGGVGILHRVSLDWYMENVGDSENFDEELDKADVDVIYLVDLEGKKTGWDFLWAREESVKRGTRFINGILPAIEGLKIGLFDVEAIEKGSGDGYKAVAWVSFDDAEVVELSELDGVVEVGEFGKPGAKKKAPKMKDVLVFSDEDEDDAKPKAKATTKKPNRSSRKASFLDSMF